MFCEYRVYILHLVNTVVEKRQDVSAMEKNTTKDLQLGQFSVNPPGLLLEVGGTST